MKVVCIDNRKLPFKKSKTFDDLTIGKVYDVDLISSGNKIDSNQYRILDDSNCYYWYLDALFIDLEKHRQKQLDILVSED